MLAMQVQQTTSGEQPHRVSTVVEDLSELVSAHRELMRYEFHAEVDRVSWLMYATSLVAHIAGIGLLLIALAAVHGLVAVLSWPLTTSYLVVGCASAVIGAGGALAFARKARARTRRGGGS